MQERGAGIDSHLVTITEMVFKATRLKIHLREVHLRKCD